MGIPTSAGSWAHLGPKSEKSAFDLPPAPPLGPQLEPQNPTKININHHKINQKNNKFLK